MDFKELEKINLNKKRQEIWLRAWCAVAVKYPTTAGMYAKKCLDEFNKIFNPSQDEAR